MILDVTQLWDSLGTAWSSFEDKPTVEAFWYALASGIDAIDSMTMQIQKSRSLPYLEASFNNGPDIYKIVYSGLTTDLTVTPLTSGGLFEFGIDPYVYSIPNLYTSYRYQGTTYSGIYTEGIHYTISGLNTLVWGDTPPSPDLRFADKGVIIAYAPTVWRLNPVLMNVWARMVGLTYDQFTNYNTYGQPSFTHLKMLIWALANVQQGAPSIANLKKAYGISRGLPFAYVSGLINSVYQTDHYISTIGNYSYTLPSGMIPLPNGTAINKFDIICSGLTLSDYVNNPTLVNEYANVYNKRNILIYKLSNTANVAHDQTFHANYITKLMPTQINWFESMSISMNNELVSMNNENIYMNED